MKTVRKENNGIQKRVVRQKSQQKEKQHARGGRTTSSHGQCLETTQKKILLLLFIIVLQFYSKSNLAALGVSQLGSRSNCERSSLLTETGYNDAGSQTDMTRYNTRKKKKKKRITKLGITAFEIVYLQIQRVNLKRRVHQARRKHGLRFSMYSVIIVVVMQSLISWWRK